MNIPYSIINILHENFSFVIQYLHFIFHYVIILFVCLSLYLSFFPKKSSILSVIICNPQFHDTYVRLKSSVLPENVSTSLFKYILITLFSFWFPDQSIEESGILIIASCHFDAFIFDRLSSFGFDDKRLLSCFFYGVLSLLVLVISPYYPL